MVLLATTAAASCHPVSTVIFYSPISFKHHITGSCPLSSAKNLLANAKVQATLKDGGCDTWVREYRGGGKDIVESGSISLFTME